MEKKIIRDGRWSHSQKREVWEHISCRQKFVKIFHEYQRSCSILQRLEPFCTCPFFPVGWRCRVSKRHVRFDSLWNPPGAYFLYRVSKLNSSTNCNWIPILEKTHLLTVWLCTLCWLFSVRQSSSSYQFKLANCCSSERLINSININHSPGRMHYHNVCM